MAQPRSSRWSTAGYPLLTGHPGWTPPSGEQRLTSVPGRELLAPATGAPNVQIWVFNAVIVIKPASMQTAGIRVLASSTTITLRDMTVSPGVTGLEVHSWRGSPPVPSGG
jgi:hypothetical protein